MSFDTLAPFYGWMERIFAGGKMQRGRVAFLNDIPEPKNILMLGEGHGRFLVPCRLKFPNAQITVVDASTGMIAQARRNLAQAALPENAVQFVHADIFEWPASEGSFDLIATHFFLDCFREDQLSTLIPKLAHCATPGAHWLLTDFQIAASGLRRLRSRVIIASLYAFFRMTTRLPATQLISADPFLEHAGFTLHKRIESDWSLLRSDWWLRNGIDACPRAESIARVAHG